MSEHCCRLDQEFILGVVRNRSGIDAGEIDYNIKCHRLDAQSRQDLKEIISTLKDLETQVRKAIAEKEGFGWDYLNNKPSQDSQSVYC